MAGSVIHVYHEPGAALLADEVRALGRDAIALASRDALGDAMPQIEYLFAPDPPRTGWAGATRLRLIQLLGAGVDQLLPSPDLPAGVAIAGARGEFAAEVAEHVIAMMLAHAHRLPALLDDQRARRFDQRPHPSLAGGSLAVIGLGEVGMRVARLARAFGMTVRAAVRRPRVIDGIELVTDLGDAVTGAHYVAIAVPLTPETRGSFDAAIFARMRPEAFVVNVARGEVIDDAALLGALASGRIAGAALDVFAIEPLPANNPMWDAPNLVITPHVAGYGERYVARCAAILVDNVKRLEAGGPLRGAVDRTLGY